MGTLYNPGSKGFVDSECLQAKEKEEARLQEEKEKEENKDEEEKKPGFDGTWYTDINEE